MTPSPRRPIDVTPEVDRRPRETWRLGTAICVIGLLLTAAGAWGTRQIDDTTEQRLLQQQTDAAGAVLSTAILLIQQPLSNALAVQSAGMPAQAATFKKLIAGSVGDKGLFANASLWKRRDGTVVRLAALGDAPRPAGGAATIRAYLQAAFTKPTFTVTLTRRAGQDRIAYALADPRTGYAVYAERAIPANRRASVDSNSAFADLNYAIYLGSRTDSAALTTTDVDPASLPLTGTTAATTVPFGDRVLTVVTSSRRHLGAPLSQRLPLLLVLAGLCLTAAALVTSRQLVRRRHAAEDNAAFAIGMSERLQRALLPPKVPDVANLEVAVEYVAGAQGVDIGGDWYSIVALDEDHFGFVIGDVSGRGIDAVAVMARARFTLRAYLLRGDSPEAVLGESSGQFDISEDGHIATTIVGIGNCRTGEVVLANAGHCAPLVVGPGDARFVETSPGPPLGTGPFTYDTCTFTLRSGEALFLFTDGLIERRGEHIDTGMERLRTHVEGAAAGSLQDLVTATVRALRDDRAEDDIAALAFRWVDPDAT